jgi:hypothetical protein
MKYHRYPLFVFEQPLDEWIKPRTIPYIPPQEQILPTSQPQSASNTEGIKVSPLLTTPNAIGSPLRTYTTASSKSKYIWWEIEEHDRDNFNIRAWANQLGMKPVGAHLVRCVWDENVPNIFEKYGIKERAFKSIKSEENARSDFPNKYDHRDFTLNDSS